MLDLVSFITLGLATMRLSMLLADEHGPWSILEKMRYRLGVRYDKFSNRYGKNMIANGIMCTYCNSVWLGFFLAALYLVFKDVAIMAALPFALSGLAILPRLKYN